MTEQTKTPGRRNLLKGAAVAAGAMSVPMISTPQTTVFQFQSTWPAKDIFHEFAGDLAKKINDMAGSRLKIEVLPAGAVVPASRSSRRRARRSSRNSLTNAVSLKRLVQSPWC